MASETVERRGTAREDAILAAALALLAEVGYDRMSMDAVAARAKASKATMYRRWSGKAQLVVTAIERHARRTSHPVRESGTLRGDLLATVRMMRDGLATQDADLLLGLMTAMRHDAELASTVRRQMIDDKREAFKPAVERAVHRGELPPTADRDVLAEVTSALLIARMFINGKPLDDAFLVHLVDNVLTPLIHRQPNDPGC